MTETADTPRSSPIPPRGGGSETYRELDLTRVSSPSSATSRTRPTRVDRMSEEKRRDSAGRVASALALPEWSLRRKLALALTIPMLLAATFGGLRVHTELAQSDNYSATAKQVTVLRPAVGYLAAAERAIIISRQKPALDDPARVSAIEAVDVAGKRLEDAGEVGRPDLGPAQAARHRAVAERPAARRQGLRLGRAGGLPGPPAAARCHRADRRDRGRADRARAQAGRAPAGARRPRLAGHAAVPGRRRPRATSTSSTWPPSSASSRSSSTVWAPTSAPTTSTCSRSTSRTPPTSA